MDGSASTDARTLASDPSYQVVLCSNMSGSVLSHKAVGNSDSPIHRLPCELLAHIFLLGHQRIKSHKRSLAIYLHTITAVCNLWREIALSHSALWTTIRFVWHPAMRQIQGNTTAEEMVKHRVQCLRKLLVTQAHHGPLNVHIDLRDLGAMLWEGFLVQLGEHSARCRTLSFTFAFLWESNKVLPQFLEHPLPELEDLQLNLLNMAPDHVFSDQCLHIPPGLAQWRLRSLGVFGFAQIPLYAINSKTLECLSFDLAPYPIAERMLSLLSSTPNLRKLEVSIRSETSINLRLNPRLHLPNLEQLTIVDTSHLDFALPRFDHDRDHIVQAAHTAMRSNPYQPRLDLTSLRKLVIRTTPKLDPWAVRDILDQFPSLHTFEVQHCSYLSHALLPLAPNPLRRRWPTMHLREDVEELTVVPHLSVLRIRDSVDLVEAGSAAPARLGTFLRDTMDSRPGMKIECDAESFVGSCGALHNLKAVSDERVEVMDFAVDV